MATNEEILGIPDITSRYGVSIHLVRSYIEAGQLRGWRNGDGKKAHWHFPASLCERIFARYRGALTSEDVSKLANMTTSGVLQAAKAGALGCFRAPKGEGQDGAKPYFERKEVDRWLASRSRGRKHKLADPIAGQANGHATDVQLPLDTEPEAPIQAPAPRPDQGIEQLAKTMAALAEAVNVHVNAVRLLRGDVMSLAQTLDKLARWVEELSKPPAK